MAEEGKTVPQSENDRSNLGVILDPDLKIKPGARFFSSIKESSVDDEWKSKKLLSLSEVKDLWKEIHGAESLKEMETQPRRKVYLHELFADAELIIPNLEIPKRNSELEKRISALKNSLAEKEYRRMTHNVNLTSQYKPEDSIGYQMKQMNTGMIAVLQLVISLGCAFFFGFTGVELFIGNLQLAFRLLLGIGCALIVGAAELYFLAVNIAVSEEGLIPVESINSRGHLKTS